MEMTRNQFEWAMPDPNIVPPACAPSDMTGNFTGDIYKTPKYNKVFYKVLHEFHTGDNKIQTLAEYYSINNNPNPSPQDLQPTGYFVHIWRHHWMQILQANRLIWVR